MARRKDNIQDDIDYENWRDARRAKRGRKLWYLNFGMEMLEVILGCVALGVVVVSLWIFFPGILSIPIQATNQMKIVIGVVVFLVLPILLTIGLMFYKASRERSMEREYKEAQAEKQKPDPPTQTPTPKNSVPKSSVEPDIQKQLEDRMKRLNKK